MTREELVEKVALDIRNASCLTPTYPFKVFDPNEAEANIREWCKYAALAAIAVVREEAAKVAEEARPEVDVQGVIMRLGFLQAGLEIAAAIRALGKD